MENSIFSLDGNKLNQLDMRTLSLLILLNLMNSSCSKQFFPDDDVLSNSRKDYTGDNLKTEGYFYRINHEGKIFDGYFFYRNGIILSLGGLSYSQIGFDMYIETEVLNGDMSSRIKSAWGVFNIEDDNLLFERWHPGRPFKTYCRIGKILNDTTFHITESYRMQNGQKTEIRERDEIYHFRQFSPKPDSTNSFVP